MDRQPLAIGVLGPVQVVAASGVVPVRGARPLAVLALLALHQGEALSAERLLDDVWGEAPPQGGTAAVQVQVSKLRAALGAAVIVTTPGGYCLATDVAEVDCHTFEALARRGRELAEAGDVAGAVARWQDALGVWRGDALGGIGAPPFAGPARARLEELRQTCLEDGFDAQLLLGRHRALVPELELHTALHPLRERLWAQLMVALYRSGRQADALRAFQLARATLAEELGIEPSGELLRLEAAVLAQSPSLDLDQSQGPSPGSHRRTPADAASPAGAPSPADATSVPPPAFPGGPAPAGTSAPAGALAADPAPTAAAATAAATASARTGAPGPGVDLDELGRAGGSGAAVLAGRLASTGAALTLGSGSWGRRTNITAPAKAFIGRAAERLAVDALVDRSRLVTLVGPGGAGKTRLAVETARGRLDRYGDGVWMAELAALRDPEQVPALLHDTFGLREVAPGAPFAAGPDDFGRLVDYLDGKDLLLVLDNCEHVVGACARLVQVLLASCPSLSVLATSREGLGIDAEVLWPVPPLRLDDSVALFAERARATSPNFALAGPAVAHATEICRRLDGLPLAVELAAARARAFPLPEILDRLDDRFRLLTGGARTALPRQQTLRAVVDWSYDLLDADERAVFVRLSVFAESCTLRAAELVCGADGLDGRDVADIVTRLVDKSLVRPDLSAATARFQLLQTLADYGRERLADLGEGAVTAVADRHLRYYVELALEAEPNLRTAARSDWMGLLTAELANIRVALDWALTCGDVASALTMTSKLSWYWWLSGQPAEGRDWTERALAAAASAADTIEPMVRAEALIWSGFLRAFEGNHSEGIAELAEGTAMARAADRAELVGIGAGAGAQLEMFQGRLPEATALLDEAEAAFIRTGDPWGLDVVAMMRASADLAGGNLLAARDGLQRSLERFRRSDFGWGMTASLSQLVEVEFHLGNLDAASAYAEEAVELTARHTYRGYHVACLALRAELAQAAGDLDSADRYLAAARARAPEVALPWAHCEVAFVAGEQARLRGRLEEAEAHLRRAAELVCSAEMGNMASAISLARGHVATSHGRFAEAYLHQVDAFETAVGFGARHRAAAALEGIGATAAARGDAEFATRCLGAAERLRHEIGAPPTQPQAARLALVRQQLAAAYPHGAPDGTEPVGAAAHRPPAARAPAVSAPAAGPAPTGAPGALGVPGALGPAVTGDALVELVSEARARAQAAGKVGERAP